MSSRAAAAAAKGTPAKGDANETLNADRPCRLCIRGNAGILWVSHADCSCQFGHRRNRQFCDSRKGWPRWRPLGQRWLWPRVRLEPRAKSRLAWPGLPSWSLEARALLSRLDLGKRRCAFAGLFFTDTHAWAAETIRPSVCNWLEKAPPAFARKRRKRPAVKRAF